MSKEIKNYFVQGAVLIDVDGASLNNLGSDKSTNDNNGVLTKSIKKGRDTYALVSGQAWRYWWRESCAKNENWILSPITKVGSNQSVTEANPFKYEDDDIFGYMNAQGETYTRISPLKNSILVSVSPVKLFDEFCAFSRGDSQGSGIYQRQSYSAIMKGLFSLDLDQVGTFTSMNRSGYQNISDKTKKELLKDEKNKIVTDLIDKNIERVRLSSEIRANRVSKVLKALKTISGGAKLTTNYNSVKPDFIILAIFKGGNNPFDNIAVDEKGYTKISAKAIKEAIEDNFEYLKSNVYLGISNGFMNEFDVGEITNGNGKIKINDKEITIYSGAVNKMIDNFVKDNIEKIIQEMDDETV
ncbi:type I-B CRISPR-associated protein Cas7/Cst2/DevR [Aliarcobacter butzleri]